MWVAFRIPRDVPPSPPARTLRLVGGAAAGAMAFVLVLRVHLGLGPWHVVQDAISQWTGMQIGSAAWGLGAVFLVAAVAVGELPGLGTLAGVVLGGFFVNAMLPFVPDVHGLLLRVGVLGFATVLMAFGGALMISARVGMSPLDALMTGIYKRSPLPVSLYGVRVGLEVLGLTLGWLGGGAVGMGSVVIGLGIGPAMQAWLVVLRAMPARPPARNDHLRQLAAER